MMRAPVLEDVVVDHVVVVAERTVDDPTLLRHQWVDVVDASVVAASCCQCHSRC